MTTWSGDLFIDGVEKRRGTSVEKELHFRVQVGYEEAARSCWITVTGRF